MATFKATIFKNRQRPDKTWNVVIRFTHERSVRYISTTMYVSKEDMTRSYSIKNMDIIERCEDLIKIYRKKVSELNLEINNMDIDSIVEYIKSKNDNAGISFTSFFEKWSKQHTEIKGMKNYITAMNSFKSFFKRDDIFCHEVTVMKMKEFEESLKEHPRAQSLYTSAIVRVFNEARDYYNDEDNDIIRIKQSLKKYTIPQQNVAEKRALSEDVIRKIFELPYTHDVEYGDNTRWNLAKDCFILSFCLLGMNAVDLYNATEIDGDLITYERTKTKDRRNDHAKMVVKVHPIIKELVDKYRDDKRVFNFHRRYADNVEFGRAINLGLKQIGEKLGIDKLQFYSARHSMATIAINKVGIDKWTVNSMLNHTDISMRVTDLYIEKDFAPINEANFKLLDYVFKK
jgi:integrase